MRQSCYPFHKQTETGATVRAGFSMFWVDCIAMQVLNMLYAVAQRVLPLNRERCEHIPGIEFCSGLGDGSWLLHGLVRTMRPSVCVEIGSARGRSACYVGMALRQLKHGKLYAIDPHTSTDWNDNKSSDTYGTIQKNIHAFGVEDHVEIIRKYSGEAAEGWDRPIDMLFIDGDHSYEGVKRDWSLFTPHVAPFGVVVFHDTIWDLRPDSRWAREDMGVPRFVEELRETGYPTITIEKCCGISIVQPVKGGVRLMRS